MKKTKFSESQIVAILKEGEAGVPVAQMIEPRVADLLPPSDPGQRSKDRFPDAPLLVLLLRNLGQCHGSIERHVRDRSVGVIDK